MMYLEVSIGVFTIMIDVDLFAVAMMKELEVSIGVDVMMMLVYTCASLLH